MADGVSGMMSTGGGDHLLYMCRDQRSKAQTSVGYQPGYKDALVMLRYVSF